MLPPNSPKVSLPDYLKLLREDIKIIGISNLLKEWHSKKFNSYSFAAEKLDVSESFYRRIITGKNPAPIWVLKKLFNYDSSLSKAVYNERIYFTARNKKEILPREISPQLSYYIGYLHGDGHISKSGKKVSFTDKYLNQITLIKKLTKNLFNVDGSIYTKKSIIGNSYYVLDIRRVTINSFFSEVIGINKGRRESNSIPVIIKENKELLKWYLCGLFDAEGAMPLNPKSRTNLYIDIAMKDSQLIKEVQNLLNADFGISSYGPYTKIARSKSAESVTYEAELKIRKLSEIKKFLKTIGTIHPDKIRRKELILKLLDE